MKLGVCESQCATTNFFLRSPSSQLHSFGRVPFRYIPHPSRFTDCTFENQEGRAARLWAPPRPALTSRHPTCHCAERQAAASEKSLESRAVGVGQNVANEREPGLALTWPSKSGGLTTSPDLLSVSSCATAEELESEDELRQFGRDHGHGSVF